MAKRTILAGLVLGCILATSVAEAQDKKKEDIAEPESLSLVSKDNVVLKCTYYAGPSSKTTVPIILLHDWGGEREDVENMAGLLQSDGHSVIIPDLRGHGASTQTKSNPEAKLNYERFKKAQILGAMLDIEACKKFLVKKNNDGELNINMLCVASVGETNVLATEWAHDDWKWPAVGGIKQGQDVQALIMFGPKKKLKNYSLTQNLKSALMSGKGAKTLNVFMFWGSENSAESRDGKSIYTTLEKSRPEPTKDGKGPKKSLFKKVYKSSASVDKMINSTKGGRDMADWITKFIDAKILSEEEELRWASRTKK